MTKILNSDFRKELYKSLIDAGYDKDEAQNIIAVKYHVALKQNVLTMLSTAQKMVEEDNYQIAEYADRVKEELPEPAPEKTPTPLLLSYCQMSGTVLFFAL